MEREIIFRGKTKDNDWIYWNEFGEINFHLTDTEIALYIKDLNDELMFETIGQFTGLTDKNGKKIFEGDIVRYTRTNMYAPSCSFHGQTIVSLHKILWDSSISAFVSVHYSLSEKRIVGKGSAVLYDDRAKENIIEVIGNIHDNPELLGE